MGLFNYYTKPGPGVNKEDDKSSFAMYFAVFKRNISKFAQLNLIYLIITIVVGLLMLFINSLPVLRYELIIDLNGFDFKFKMWDMYVLPLPLLIASPFYGSAMVVMRRLANREYSFVLSEFLGGLKANWGQFLINGIISYIAYAVLSFSLIYYFANMSVNTMFVVGFVLSLIIAFLLITMQFYIPLLIVSVNLSMKNIYKNALLLSFLGVFKNILFILVILVFVFVYGYLAFLHSLAALIALTSILVISISFLFYSNAYICYPVIKRYVIDPFYAQDKKTEEVIENDEDQSLFDDLKL